MDDMINKSAHLCRAILDFSQEVQRKGYSASDANLVGYLIALSVTDGKRFSNDYKSEGEVCTKVYKFVDSQRCLNESAGFIEPILNIRHRSLIDLAHRAKSINGNEIDFIEVLDWIVDHSDIDLKSTVTPRSVADLMVKLINVGRGRLLDPAAGTGSFMQACYRHLKGEVNCTGIEENRKSLFVSHLYNILQNFYSCNEIPGNAFYCLPNGDKYDFVLSNPPINRISKNEVEHRYSDVLKLRRPSSEMSLNFIQLGLNKLREDGKAAFLVNMGVLYTQGDAKNVRQEWIERGELSAVISLPGKLLPHTSNKCAILLFGKKKPKISAVRFVKADDIYKEMPAGRNDLRENIFEIIAKRLSDTRLTPVSCVISCDHIARLGYSLHPDSYLKKEITEVASRVAKRWEKLGELGDIKQGTRSLGKLAEGGTPIICGKNVREMLNGKFEYIYKDLSKFKGKPVTTKEFDLLIQRLGENPATFVVPSDKAGMVIDQTVFLIRFHEINMSQIRFVSEFLNSKRGASHIASFCRTTTAQTLTKTVLHEIDVPIADQALRELVLEANKAELVLKQELAKATSLKSKVFEGIGFEKLFDSYDELRFSVKTLESALENKDKVSYKVANQYPFPLAYAYRNVYLEREWTAIYDRQMKYGEQVLSFLVSIGLGLLTYHQQTTSLPLSDLAQELNNALYRGMSPGHWRSMLHRLCDLLRIIQDCQLCVEFSSVWYKSRGNKLSKFATLTENEFVRKLNDKKHHRGPDGSSACKDAVAQHQQVIDQALLDIEFLSQWEFFICDELDYCAMSDMFSCSISLLTGDHPCFEQKVLELNSPLSTGEVCLRYSGEIIALFPFITVLFNDKTNRREIYSLDKLDKKGDYFLKSFDSGSTAKANNVLKQQLNDWFSAHC